jgi:hypothetical protein
LGLTQESISRYLSVFEELDHPLVKQATSIKTAVNTVKRIQERRDQDLFNGLCTVHKYIPESPIQIADFNIWAPTYTGPKFNVIHCDFPYGINSQNHHGQGRAERSTYDDSPETFWTSLRPYQSTLITSAAPRRT